MLLFPRAAGMEILPERVVLDRVPTDAHTEAQPATREQINVGRLARYECRLALRQDQDSGGELDALGDARQVAEHHERIVERVVLGIGTRQRRRSISVDRAQHMVIGQQVVEAQVLDRFANPSNSFGVAAKLRLGINNTDLHDTTLPRPGSARCAPSGPSQSGVHRFGLQREHRKYRLVDTPQRFTARSAFE